MTCRDGDLGAYVLGALGPDERRRVDEHVADCPACAAELADFESLPGLLDLVDPEDLLAAPVTPSPELFERMAAAAEEGRAAERARRGRGRLLVAAAVLAVLGAGAGVTSWVVGSNDPSHTVAQGPVHMTVTAAAQGTGTTLDVTVMGLPAEEKCRLVVVDRDGTRHEAGQWTATYEGKARFKGWSDVDRSNAEDVVLVGTHGQELVRVPL
jgi:hypothetical protein